MSRQPRDMVEWRLAWDLEQARRKVERLKRQLVRAERAVELRLGELAGYTVNGVVPKRKRVINEVNEDIIRRHGRMQRGGKA